MDGMHYPESCTEAVLLGMDVRKSGRCHRSQRRRAITAWALIAGFLLQPVLTYLVTPLVAHDGKGRQVVVCTLKGVKRVTVDLPPIADNGDAEHCTALKLYQMAGTVQISEPPAPTGVSLYAVDSPEQRPDSIHRALHFSVYTTRAPPAFS